MCELPNIRYYEQMRLSELTVTFSDIFLEDALVYKLAVICECAFTFSTPLCVPASIVSSRTILDSDMRDMSYAKSVLLMTLYLP